MRAVVVERPPMEVLRAVVRGETWSLKINLRADLQWTLGDLALEVEVTLGAKPMADMSGARGDQRIGRDLATLQNQGS